MGEGRGGGRGAVGAGGCSRWESASDGTGLGGGGRGGGVCVLGDTYGLPTRDRGWLRPSLGKGGGGGMCVEVNNVVFKLK